MGQAPSTVLQLALVVLVVLPGTTYQFLRERWRGPVPGERELGERVLRAVVASLVLDAVYVIAAGPQLLALVRGTNPRSWDGLVQHPRLAGVVGLLLFVVFPAVAAAAVSWWQRRKLRARFHRTPTAWDHAFRDRRSCFVRARLADGSWVGGWYGPRSYATSYPHPGELFLQSAWRMNPDGSFAARTPNSSGVYLRSTDITILELLDPPAKVPDEEAENARSAVDAR
ncbi:DUF6338 family protein [Saccharopolyspora sp. 5N708]|uniref:DUF6338 family protein n=1 Tax=Saccharopolyspora sp. 5N708 TaxID=3457424 RepID=UPI003FD480DC